MKQSAWILLVLAFVFGSCKKKNTPEHTVKGRVINLSNQQPVADAQVNLLAQVIENGVYNLNLNSQGKSTTNSNGEFSILFERKNTEEYHLETTGNNFFTQDLVLNADQMFTSDPKEVTIGVYTSSAVQVSFKNTNLAADSSAVFSYGYQGPEHVCACCPKTVVTKIGAADTTFQCSTYGERYFKYGYTVKRKNQPLVIKNDSIFCETGKTATINIEY